MKNAAACTTSRGHLALVVGIAAGFAALIGVGAGAGELERGDIAWIAGLSGAVFAAIGVASSRR